MISSRMEPFEHEVDHGDMHPRCTAFGALLVVFAQPSASAQPGQGAFHYPAAGQHLESVLLCRTAYQLQGPTAHRLGPLHQFTAIGPVGSDQLQPGEPTQQFGQHQLGAVPVPVSWHGAGIGYWRHEPPLPAAIPWCPPRCVVCVPLPSCPRRNPEAPFFRGLHRPAVNDGRAGRSLPSRRFPNPLPQGPFNPLPSAVIPPVAEVPPHRPPWWEVVGQHPPGDATTQHVQDAVDHLAQVCGPGMASGGVGRQQRLQLLPLSIGQIAGMRFSIHATSVTGAPFSSQERPIQVSPIVTHPLRAYPNNPAALSATRAQAK